VRKSLVIAASAFFFYGLLRDMTLLKTLMLCAAMASSYGISKIPAKYLAKAKYPVIGLSLILPLVLIIYPWIRGHHAVAVATLVLAFYSIALFLVTPDEKGKKVHNEITGLCLLYTASFIDLFLTGLSALILPLSISILLFLFIANKARTMPFVAGLTVLAMIVLLVSGVHMYATGPGLNIAERYVLLAATFALMLVGFVGFVKKPDFVSILGFFGFLFVSVDLLMSVGLHLKGILLQQPGLSLFIVGPIVGVAMKGGEEPL
jgi:hypothetical protein